MKRRFYKIILTLSLILAFTSCSNGSNQTEEVSVSSVEDLLENIDKSKPSNEENIDQAPELTDDRKDDAKDKWENSLAKAKKKEEEERKKLPKFEENPSRDGEDETEESKEVRVKFFGDTMAHLGQIQYAYNYGGGSYDFTNQFSYISDFVADADLAITNYETTTNPNRAYTGYPKFNTPPTYLDAIKEAGFDVVTTANNHALDTDEQGLFTTIDAIEESGLDFVGSFRDETERILYKDLGDLRLAILSYTYGANGVYDLLSLREEVPNLNYLKEDTIKADIKMAKSKGADFVIIYPHWGIEYQSYPSNEVIELSKNMIEWGADIIIGNHPHVVQPIDTYKASDGREGLIAYALGNFVSIQSLEMNGDIRVEQNISIEVSLKNFEDGAKITGIDIHPLWVGSNYDDYGQSIKTYLCEDFLEGGKYYDQVDEYQRERIRKAYEMSLETVREEVL
ncbi:MAG: CapA family protein [Anaerococcus sp.]|nr:CapA family protein [Anaerococcus sp.]